MEVDGGSLDCFEDIIELTETGEVIFTPACSSIYEASVATTIISVKPIRPVPPLNLPMPAWATSELASVAKSNLDQHIENLASLVTDLLTREQLIPFIDDILNVVETHHMGELNQVRRRILTTLGKRAHPVTMSIARDYITKKIRVLIERKHRVESRDDSNFVY